MTFNLVKGSMICNWSYFGDGVCYQAAYNRDDGTSHTMPVYRDNHREGMKFLIHEVSRMLREGWEIANE